MDQTGTVLVPGGNDNTYEIKGAKQVPIHGKEGKRAFTAVLSVDLGGKVLPTQSVWKGVLAASLPTIAASEEAKRRGHRFGLNKRTYWSSFETTKAWIAEILLAHWERIIRVHNLSLDSKMILYLDCWTIHRSKEFCEWIAATYLFIILLFVPANCTGIFQPCDVGLQRLFKQSVKQSASQFFVKHVQDERLKGIAPGKIRFPIKLGQLRDQTPTWCTTGVDFLNSISKNDGDNSSIGASAWRNCRAGPWNLSYDCITSTAAINEWFRLSPEYRAKIEGNQPFPREVSVGNPGLDLTEDEEMAEDGNDDEDVPAELTRSVVIGESLPVLPSGYSISEGKLAYNEEWDETAELQSDSEVESNDL